MGPIPWILISIVAVLIAFGLIAFVAIRCKKQKCEPDYRSFFIMGIVWTGAGIALYVSTKNFGFFAMGIIFLILGLANRDKWKKPEAINIQQRGKIIALSIIIFLLGVLTFASLYFNVMNDKQTATEITDFNDCAQQFPVIESYPRQCRDDQGNLFVEEIE